jgi:hypothetical protein
MLESDFGPFESAFKRLSGALNRKWTTKEFKDVCRTYFEKLQHRDLVDVLAAEHVLSKRQRWPKVGDWIAALPHEATAPSGERVMRSDEASGYLTAKRLRYADDPCACLTCLAASVSDQRRRFVPDFVDDVEDKAFCPPLNKVVVVGHWAHGEELRRWYAARDAFMACAPKRFRRLLPATVREPGEEG